MGQPLLLVAVGSNGVGSHKVSLPSTGTGGHQLTSLAYGRHFFIPSTCYCATAQQIPFIGTA